jgi:transcriptional regulator with GAF, ATPase, and Fis domain
VSDVPAGAKDTGRRGRPSRQDTGSSAGEDTLAVRLSELARGLQEQDEPAETLADVVQAAIDVIPGVEEASISVVLGRRNVTSQVPSSELARTVDAIQDEVGEDPCLDAVYEQQTVRVTDMATERRWPRFARRACAAGAGSMLAFQLYVEGDNLGALNLYARTAGAFDDESEHVGLLFAAHAAVAYAGVRKQSQLQQAIATRELIGQACGILMERYKITADRARGARPIQSGRQRQTPRRRRAVEPQR